MKIIVLLDIKALFYQTFQEYVNTLATIRQENDEKYLVLKRKYYPQFDDADDSNNYLQGIW